MAMVFQRPFMLRLSTLANVELGLMLHGVPRGERRAAPCRRWRGSGLEPKPGRIGRVLSAGQQQRAALARAWALAPDLLLLDEPTASLDPTAKREVESLIAEFVQQGITVLMSSHNLGQVKRLATRVVYLEHGRVLADVSTSHFFQGTLPEEAALFLKGELHGVRRQGRCRRSTPRPKLMGTILFRSFKRPKTRALIDRFRAVADFARPGAETKHGDG